MAHHDLPSDTYDVLRAEASTLATALRLIADLTDGIDQQPPSTAPTWSIDPSPVTLDSSRDVASPSPTQEL